MIKLTQGGIADLEAAARIVIGDWNQGKMKHYLTPPGFNPAHLIDIDELRKELMADEDDETTGMILEGEDNDASMMQTE